MTTATYQHVLEAAAECGRLDGESAAINWLADFDRTAFNARRAVDGIRDLDPEVMEWIPAPDLSGEWADGLTPATLAKCCGVDPYEAEDDLDDLCNAYDSAFTRECNSRILGELS